MSGKGLPMNLASSFGSIRFETTWMEAVDDMESRMILRDGRICRASSPIIAECPRSSGSSALRRSSSSFFASGEGAGRHGRSDGPVLGIGR
jgi:hypothetical protein